MNEINRAKMTKKNLVTALIIALIVSFLVFLCSFFAGLFFRLGNNEEIDLAEIIPTFFRAMLFYYKSFGIFPTAVVFIISFALLQKLKIKG